MMVKKLNVHRRFGNGNLVKVGELAQNRQGIFFQYDEAYINDFHSLSPFTLPFETRISQGASQPHRGLHGVFADSLPDGWGLLLMDRIFRQQGILPQQITPLDRLAFIGDRGMGSLTYSPSLDYTQQQDERLTDIALMGSEAQRVFEGATEDVLPILAETGSSGGARPKTLVWFDSEHSGQVSTLPGKGLSPWLVKFTSRNLPLGHEESLCEAAWLTMAEKAGLSTPNWKLIRHTGSSQAEAWLALQRFDCTVQEQKHGKQQGRFHMHTLCGLMDADFRQPSMDYEDLIKVSQVLCQSPTVAQEQFGRAMFNLLALNQDDHTKNWSFLMNDDGQWSLSPFYDVTFSPAHHNQHMTAYMGHGSEPPLNVVKKLAVQANFANWNRAKEVIERILDALQEWPELAKSLGVQPSTVKLIAKQLQDNWKANKHLLQ